MLFVADFSARDIRFLSTFFSFCPVYHTLSRGVKFSLQLFRFGLLPCLVGGVESKNRIPLRGDPSTSFAGAIYAQGDSNSMRWLRHFRLPGGTQECTGEVYEKHQ